MFVFPIKMSADCNALSFTVIAEHTKQNEASLYNKVHFVSKSCQTKEKGFERWPWLMEPLHASSLHISVKTMLHYYTTPIIL